MMLMRWETLSGGQAKKEASTSFVRVHVLNSFSDFLFGNCQVVWAILAVLHDRLRLRKSGFVFSNFCLRFSASPYTHYLNKTFFSNNSSKLHENQDKKLWLIFTEETQWLKITQKCLILKHWSGLEISHKKCWNSKAIVFLRIFKHCVMHRGVEKSNDSK